jgi:hypothetical protein
MPQVVNSDFSTQAAEKGDTIDVPIPTAVGTTDVVPSNTPPSPTDTTPAKVQVPLDNWKQNDPIYLTDKDMVEIDRNEHFLPMQLQEAINALATDVNTSIYSEYITATLDQGVYGYTGTAGTTPFGSTVVDATNARKTLNKQKCPKSPRVGVLDFDAEANALALAPFSDAEKIMSATVKIEGEIGRKYGIDWLADDDVPTHTAGTIAATGSPSGRKFHVNNGAGYAAGIDTINVDNGPSTAVTGTILVGDIIEFTGHAQTYCVVANTGSGQYSAGVYTFATNAIAGLKFYPALTDAVVDDEEADCYDTHVLNLVFHRDAFAFATRPLADATTGVKLGSEILTMQDPLTGLVLRLEVSRQHKQVAWEFDILWGVKLVRPQLVCRVAG